MSVATFTDRHGTEFSVQVGGGGAFCSKCKEMFNSVAAFDKHIQRKGQKGRAKHVEPSSIGMMRNSRGLWVTALMPREALGPTDSAVSPSS